MIRNTEEIKTQGLRIIITMTIVVEMMIKMVIRLIITDDKNNDSYKNDDKY